MKNGDIRYPNPIQERLQKIKQRFKNYIRHYSDGHYTFNHPWFLEAIAEQPTLLKKIKKWLELEYKSWFTPRTSAPKIPTPLSTFKWHLRYAIPDLIRSKLWNFRNRTPYKIYNETVNYLNEAYEDKCSRIEYLESVVEELIEYYAEHTANTKDGKRTYDYEAIKEKYENVFGERYGVPKEYRDPNEEEDDECHCPTCEGEGDYIANATLKDLADWNITELKDRGLYHNDGSYDHFEGGPNDC